MLTKPDTQDVEITPELQSEARARGHAIGLALDNPASEDQIRKWLIVLGTLTAGNLSVDDVALKLKSLTSMLAICGFTHLCYSQRTLERVAGKFKFFPAYEELKAELQIIQTDFKLESGECIRIGLIGIIGEQRKKFLEAGLTNTQIDLWLSTCSIDWEAATVQAKTRFAVDYIRDNLLPKLEIAFGKQVVLGIN